MQSILQPYTVFRHSLLILLTLCYYFIMIEFVFTTVTRVTNQPDGVTTIATCEGWRAEYTCVLNSNINSNEVRWYRYIRDTSTTVMLNQRGTNINFAT